MLAIAINLLKIVNRDCNSLTLVFYLMPGFDTVSSDSLFFPDL